MDLEYTWALVRKELKIIKKKKSILVSLILIPLIVAIIFSYIIATILSSEGANANLNNIIYYADLFAFFFVGIAGIIPPFIASYSIIGEKLEKSLEPLLATPASDGEILLGKFLGAFIPSVVCLYVGNLLYMILADIAMGVFYYPNTSMAFIIFLETLNCTLSIEVCIVISAHINDLRSAQGFSTLMGYVPFVAIVVLSALNMIVLDEDTLLFICAIIVVVDVLLFYVSKATFRREEILTRWK